MTVTPEHPATSLLHRLSTLRDLTPDELHALSDRLFVSEDGRGTVLLELGATDESTLYLLEGSCRLIAEDGGVKVIHHTDPSALAPLARLRPSRYRVVAETAVRYLLIDGGQVADMGKGSDADSTLSLQTYEVEEEDDYGQLDAENRLTLQIYEDLNADRLLLPSLPHVAVQIGEAVNDPMSDAKRIAGLIETDPAIAVKIIKAANSARFGGVSSVTTVAEAVARLGLQNTQLLVITFALRELFRTTSKTLEARMRVLWEHSRRIAALSQVLATKVSGFNAHEALLAGLVHDIGSLAVIGYARDFSEVIENPPALEASIQALRSQLSGMILAKWRLPPEVVTAAKEAENWYREHKAKADYADLVIVAQIHDGVAGDIDLSRVPALARLGLSASELDSGLDLLNAAETEVGAAQELLAG